MTRRRSPKIQVVIDRKLQAWLRKKATEGRRSVSQYVRILLEEAMARDQSG